MEMLDFCILCIDDFKILKIFNKLSKFSTIFSKNRHRYHPSHPPPQCPYDVSHGQNQYVNCFPNGLGSIVSSKSSFNY